MYYYIFEPAQNKGEVNRQEDIKAILQKNQVAGEFVTLSLAEKPQDLAKIGLRRGFSTIVGVGNNSLINQVARALINTDYTLGIVPIDPKSSFLKMIGAKDYEEACLALPKRRVTRIDTALINNQHSLVTQAIIRPKSRQPELIRINFENHYRTEVRLNEILISNIGVNLKAQKIRNSTHDDLVDIYIPAKANIRRGIWAVFSRLKQENREKGSLFHVKKGTIESRKTLEMIIDSRIIGSSPFEIQSVPRSLNIIVKREEVNSS